jgi:ribose transport system ATP-binding protein
VTLSSIRSTSILTASLVISATGCSVLVSRGLSPATPARHQAAVSQVMLSVKGLSRSPKVKDVSFDLHAGEVLGIGGLVGAGRSELARLLFGADQPDAGRMSLSGKPFSPKSPKVAVKAGVGLVPEERRTEGLVMTKSIAFNLSLANLDHVVISRMVPIISPRTQSTLAQSTIKALAIKANGQNTPVGRLSGGNQQKVVIGRWIQRSPLVLILDEPTRGVDIGARAEIHRLIRDLANNGMAVLVISSEPDELPDLCDRVLVMVEGRIMSELKGHALTRKAIVEACYSQTPNWI